MLGFLKSVTCNFYLGNRVTDLNFKALNIPIH